MIRAIRLAVIWAVTTSCAGSALAFDQDHVFVQALKTGSASSPIADDPIFSRATAALQKQAGNSGPLYIEARRLLAFAHQPRCGRVAFVVSQPASHHIWANLGGQLNICDDGQPPLQSCKGVSRLIAAGSVCPDGSRPVDTVEVASAIQSAITAGGLTPTQARDRFTTAQPVKGDARTPR